MRPFSGIVVLMVVAAGVAGAADSAPRAEVVAATVDVQAGWLHADIQLRNLIDSRTASTIDSGLSGVCAYEVSVVGRGGAVVVRRVWTLQLDHDLWEDRYIVRGPTGDQTLPSLAAMDSLCSRIDNLRLFPVGNMDQGTEYRLVVAVEILPLGAEDRNLLSNYVSRRGSSSREELDLDLGSLFSRLLTGGGARTTLIYTGPTFRLRTLEHRP